MIHWHYFSVKEKALAICSSLAIIAAILAFYFFGPSIDSSYFYFNVSHYDRVAKISEVTLTHIPSYYWLVLATLIIVGIILIVFIFVLMWQINLKQTLWPTLLLIASLVVLATADVSLILFCSSRMLELTGIFIDVWLVLFPFMAILVVKEPARLLNTNSLKTSVALDHADRPNLNYQNLIDHANRLNVSYPNLISGKCLYEILNQLNLIKSDQLPEILQLTIKEHDNCLGTAVLEKIKANNEKSNVQTDLKPFLTAAITNTNAPMVQRLICSGVTIKSLGLTETNYNALSVDAKYLVDFYAQVLLYTLCAIKDFSISKLGEDLLKIVSSYVNGNYAPSCLTATLGKYPNILPFFPLAINPAAPAAPAAFCDEQCGAANQQTRR